MAKLTVGSECILTGAPLSIKRKIAEALTIKNPMYEKSIKYGRFVSPNISSVLRYFTRIEDTLMFPRGFGYSVLKMFEDAKEPLEIETDLIEHPKQNFTFYGELRDYQSLAIRNITAFNMGTLEAQTGAGKCHPKGTKVIMFSGETKKVEDVVNGDVLMGPDSTPRTVSGVTKGYGSIYKVTPIKGESWECNSDHILSLKRTKYFQKNGNGKGGKFVGGDLCTVSIKEYISKSDRFKHLWKLWRPPGIDFPHVPVWEPYIIGFYLADGTKKYSIVHGGVQKEPCIAYIESKCRVTSKVFTKGCWTVRLGDFEPTRKTLVTDDNKRVIPNEYIINSKEVRLQLLAGILDGDGSYGHGGFEITCKDSIFSKYILYLCRSLGFSANCKKVTKRIKSNGFTGDYYRILINGDLDTIPTKVLHKQAAKRLQKKDHLVTGFTVEYAREDDYFGFNLDKDHLYLLDNFTVTHNTVMALAILAARNQPTLILVHTKELMFQWVKRIEEFLHEEAGMIGAGQYIIKPITVGISISVRNNLPKIKKMFGHFVCDECHRIAATSFTDIVAHLNPKYILGLSATQYRSDGLTPVIFFYMGPKTHVVKKEDTGKSVLKPKIIFRETHVHPKCTVEKNVDYQDVIKEVLGDKTRKELIVNDVVKDVTSFNEPVLIVSDRVNYIEELQHLLVKKGMTTALVTGSVNNADRARFFELVRNGHTKVLLATTSLVGEGFDCKELAAVFLATPIKFKGRVTQVVGRAIRSCEGKHTPRVYDYRDSNFNMLKYQGFERDKVYKKEKWI